MQILIWIIFGGLVGWVASMIVGTDAEQGIVLNVVVGILGAVIGGWLMGFVGQGDTDSFNLYSFVVSLLGAVVLLGVVRMFRRI